MKLDQVLSAGACRAIEAQQQGSIELGTACVAKALQGRRSRLRQASGERSRSLMCRRSADADHCNGSRRPPAGKSENGVPVAHRRMTFDD
jgi:hypothetical protein